MGQIRTLVIPRRLDKEFQRTIGRRKPEVGGFFTVRDGRIADYYFDRSAKTSTGTYTPDEKAVNRWIKHSLKPGDLLANIHSHPRGCARLSEGDRRYALEIMRATGQNGFIILIAQVSKALDGDLKLYGYEIGTDGTVRELRLVVEGKAAGAPASAGIFQRIENSYPLDVLRRKTVVIIGTGGAAGFAEDLTRSGVGNFVLIDPDVFTASNIATQQAYITDIGRPKVEVLKERILNINPNAKVAAVRRVLDDGMRDESFAALVWDKLLTNSTDVLICGCTDSFPAQVRASALAMKYGTPYLAAQMYAGGEAAEIYFSYPGATVGGCPRCVLRSRYEAYGNGYRNTVTSAGCPIFSTTQLNAIKGQIAMMLLLYHEDARCRYNTMLDQVADRNFVQLRLSPTAGEHLGLHIFDGATDDELSFFGETVWIPTAPDGDCPLCHGNPDLSALKGTIVDTREAAQ